MNSTMVQREPAHRLGRFSPVGALALALAATALACGGDATANPPATATTVATQAAPAATGALATVTATATLETTPTVPSLASPPPTLPTDPTAPVDIGTPVPDRTVESNVGDLAPDFTLTIPGGEVTLSSLREQDKPFLLISFATW